jgi:hypothetical protein
LCGNRNDHSPHIHDSGSLGRFWCTADQSTRLPYAAERRREAAMVESEKDDSE